MIETKPTAVILGLGVGVNGIEIARCLALHNAPLYGLYEKSIDIGRFSKYLKAIKAADLTVQSERFL
jgi:hypothetical protein